MSVIGQGVISAGARIGGYLGRHVAGRAYFIPVDEESCRDDDGAHVSDVSDAPDDERAK